MAVRNHATGTKCFLFFSFFLFFFLSNTAGKVPLNNRIFVNRTATSPILERLIGHPVYVHNCLVADALPGVLLDDAGGRDGVLGPVLSNQNISLF